MSVFRRKIMFYKKGNVEETFEATIGLGDFNTSLKDPANYWLSTESMTGYSYPIYYGLRINLLINNNEDKGKTFNLKLVDTKNNNVVIDIPLKFDENSTMMYQEITISIDNGFGRFQYNTENGFGASKPLYFKMYITTSFPIHLHTTSIRYDANTDTKTDDWVDCYNNYLVSIEKESSLITFDENLWYNYYQ